MEDREEQLQKAYVGNNKPSSRPIEIVDYDLLWPGQFKEEARSIRAALGDKVLQLEHAGSTSVPGLPAKPVIDIVLAVANSADEPAYVPAMEAAGYTLVIREPEWHEHRVFRGPRGVINLHVFSSGCPEIERMLAFRDRLRSDTSDRELYARTKRELAQKEWKFVQDYADAKTEVVVEILKRSRDAA
jgi:GrpB-like predicted nucleotidyltransferase (UPF0157 family)